jgi:hypothetical protein
MQVMAGELQARTNKNKTAKTMNAELIAAALKLRQ